jgi:hypothetical protein
MSQLRHIRFLFEGDKMCMRPIEMICNDVDLAVDFSCRAFRDLSNTANITRLFSYTISLINLHLQDPVLKPLLKNLRIVSEISIAKSWIRNIHDIFTGKFIGEPLRLSNGMQIPNVFGICTHLSLLGYEVGFTLRWLEQQEVLNLASIAAGLSSQALLTAQTVCGTVACISDILNASYEMLSNRSTADLWMNIALDVSRLVTIFLYQYTATYTISLLALIANMTYSSIMLAKFVSKEYNITIS